MQLCKPALQESKEKLKLVYHGFTYRLPSFISLMCLNNDRTSRFRDKNYACTGKQNWITVNPILYVVPCDLGHLAIGNRTMVKSVMCHLTLICFSIS